EGTPPPGISPSVFLPFLLPPLPAGGWAMGEGDRGGEAWQKTCCAFRDDESCAETRPRLGRPGGTDLLPAAACGTAPAPATPALGVDRLRRPPHPGRPL